MNKELELSNMLHTFICEMENTLKDKNKRNRAYATQVFWKNKYTLELIENALKRLENYEQNEDFNKDVLNYAFLNEKDKIKKLKALEIIKEKRVDVCYFMNCKTLEEYNDDVLASYAYEEDDAEQRMLTPEEYALLKEELL